MIKFFLAAATMFTAQYSFADTQCSYVDMVPCAWDYAPGYLTMDGVEYTCPNSNDKFVDQTCKPKDSAPGKTFRAVVDAKHTVVKVYTNPNDVQGTLVCTGPATEDWQAVCN